MEIKEVKTYLPLMHSLHLCGNHAARNIILSHLDEPSFRHVTKWLNRGIENPAMLKLSPKRLSTLRKALHRDKSRVKYITKGKGSLKNQKRKVQQSGTGIGLLLGILAPIVVGLVKDLITKGKKK